jgi:hypothetical protein
LEIAEPTTPTKPKMNDINATIRYHPLSLLFR